MKGAIVGLLFSAILLTLLEVVISFTLPKSRLDQILNVLERDSLLIWKQRPNLKTDFFNEEIQTDELGLRNKINLNKKSKLRMLVLGASPTFGWGVPQDETYAKRLEKKFSNKLEVINAAHIGHSSYQGLLFLKKNIKQIKPDIVSIPYVINDVDRYRFFENSGGPDKSRIQNDNKFILTSNFISKLEIVRLMRTLVLSFRENDPKLIQNDFKFKEARVPFEQYKKNLEEFNELSKVHNFKIIFVKMPVNLPLGPTSNPIEDLTKVSELSCDQKVLKIDLLLKSSSLIPELYHMQAQCFYQLNKVSEAKETLLKLKQIQSHRAARDALQYNQYIESYAKKLNKPLVDIVSVFKQHKGEYLFVDKKMDTIHPNSLGHKLIAEAISKDLEQTISSFE